MTEKTFDQENRREELICGKVVAMSPSPGWNHVSIADNIYTFFSSYLRGKKCRAISDGFDLYLDDDNIFIPDMMVVCDRDKIKQRGVYGAPDLVVEILSPSTGKRDRWQKKNAYESSGVPEYWIVDPKAKSIEAYLLSDGKYILDGMYSYRTDEEIQDLTDDDRAAVATEIKCHLYDDFTIPLADIFGDLL